MNTIDCKNNKDVGNKKKNKVELSPPKIDKIAAIAKLPDDGINNVIYSNLIELIKDPDTPYIQTGSKKYNKVAVKLTYPTTVALAGGEVPVMHVSISHPASKRKEIRIEFNPKFLCATAVEFLNTEFEAFIGMNFQQFMCHTKITRIDVCRDIMDRELQDFLIKVKGSKSSQNFFDKDMLVNIVFGKPGNNQYVAYQKNYDGKNADHPKCLRIEVRSRTQIMMNDLLLYKNPLLKIDLYDMNCKKPPLRVGAWIAFQDSCRVRGISGAINVQPQSIQKALKKCVSGFEVTWWNLTDEEWQKYWVLALDRAYLLEKPDYVPSLTHSELIGG